ncbi:MAG: 30S ribosomal protein S16 [Edaphobacter sp.]
MGTYNPRTNPATVALKRDRIDYWVGNGAQLSERVGKLMAQAPAATETASAA